MYPLQKDEVYPRNQWYIAAWAEEVTRDPFERSFLDEPVVLYRTEAGRPAALAGLCPHRLYPMSRGKLVGDNLQCGYHGFTFDPAGKCVRIPTQENVPAIFSTKSFPIVEKGPLVWIWLGDKELADAADIPDTPLIGIGNDSWRFDKVNLYSLAARYQILIDNLMDLTHIGFTHVATIPKGERLIPLPPEIVKSDAKIIVTRNYPPSPVDGLAAHLYPDLAGKVCNQKITSEYFGPNLINAGGLYVEDPASQAWRMVNFVHGFTPEGPTSTHYFVAVTRNFRLDDEALSDILRDSTHRTVLEDIAALEAIEPHINRHADRNKELSCRADNGAILVRRALSAQIKAEQGV